MLWVFCEIMLHSGIGKDKQIRRNAFISYLER
jgi:hypothetical protein